MECGFVFERFDKAQEICRPGIALHQYVEVVRHQAVRTKGEGLLGGNLVERFQNPAGNAARAEIGDAIAGAESEKVGAGAEIVLFWQADGFVETLGGFEGRRHG